MNLAAFKRTVPTFMGWLERRRQSVKPQLPRHLRPPSFWPLRIQVMLNLAVVFGMIALYWYKEEFMTEAAPAAGLVVALLVLIYTLISAFKLKQRFEKLKGRWMAAFNFWLMILAFLSWAASIVSFLP